MEFGIYFKFDAEGDPPSVFIATRDGTQHIEVFEEPTLKVKEWSWNDEDWAAGPTAKQLVTFMNSDFFTATA